MRLLSVLTLSLFLLPACSNGKESQSEDVDGDGYSVAGGDCNDDDPAIHPDAEDVPGDGVDEDCSGSDAVEVDADGDGYCGNPSLSPDCAAEADCDDQDEAVNPAAEEIWYDGVDQNCDGNDADHDEDGVDGGDGGADCDDLNPDGHPGVPEDCATEADDDCDGQTDAENADGCTPWYADADADSFGDDAVSGCVCLPPAGSVLVGGDCDDTAAAINPDALEVCDGADNDCDGDTDDADAGGAEGQGTWYVDGDGDLHGAGSAVLACTQPSGTVLLNDDCNDVDATIFPGAVEIPNDGIDADCDGSQTDGGTDDQDGDTYVASLDCDDTNPAINPAATELCDGVDNNCDALIDDSSAADAGTWFADADGDGYGDAASATVSCTQPAATVTDSSDCDDADGSIHPTALEVLGDGIDQDCDGLDPLSPDEDQDGFDSVAVGGVDCNDNDAAIYPGATEVCDNVDNNCDGVADEGVTLFYFADADGDGYGDGNTTMEACSAPVGYVVDATDCNDADATISPAATEVCDAADTDENCDGLADDADPAVDPASYLLFAHDKDGDSYGDANDTVAACELPSGYLADASDCNDADATISPAAQEICDASRTDEDCNGLADDADPNVSSLGQISAYADNDGDGYGDPAGAQSVCHLPSGSTLNALDCDDADGAVSPAATEICDATDTDENCDGSADDLDATVDPASYLPFYPDLDGDGFGDMSDPTYACDVPSGLLADGTDCDDADAAVSPAATEICDSDNVDEDCNGASDDADVGVDPSSFTTWYADADGDGFGVPKVTLDACDKPGGYVGRNDDCNDAAAAINPGATEVCDAANVDEDCDGLADDQDSSTAASSKNNWYTDADGDGYGDVGASATVACEKPAQSVQDHSDCDDGNVAINPGKVEVCDGGDSVDTDENCNGLADDADPAVDTNTVGTFFGDFDNDGYGDANVALEQCNTPLGYTANSDDCDDGDGAINPAATEICDSANVDEDCDTFADDKDGDVDPGTYSQWYADSDGDTYGNPSSSTYACDKPVGYVATATDCNDGSSIIHPGATEVCDAANVDEDCDTLADDKDPSVDTATYTSWYKDADSDTYGSGSALSRCDQPTGYVSNATDCDDAVSTTHPSAADVCQNGVDADCTDSCTWVGNHADTEAKSTYTGTSNGGTSFGFLGGNLSGGRDINGDGYSDIAIGDRLWDSLSTNQNLGKVYLLAGKSGGVTDTIAAPTAVLTGGAAGDRVGGGLSMMDDVNGDIKDELLVGAYLDNVAFTDCGSAMLFRGGSSGALTPANASVTVNGTAANDYLGWAVSGGGDLTGDGTPDWAVSAYFNNTAASKAGKVAVVSGALAAGTYNYTSMTAVLSGVAANDRFGASILADIDVNGDGKNDLLVDSIGQSTTYVFLGPVSGSKSYAAADYTITGVALTANSASSESNCSDCIANAGDNNNDGYDDLLLGADGYDSGTLVDAGGAFLFNGPIQASTTVNSATANILGVVANDFTGRSVSGAWDVDYDGYDDFLVGAPGYDASNGEGMAALVYGPTSGSYTIGSTGLTRFVGSITAGSLGTAVMGVGDVDGDGDGEFMFGAPNAIDGGTYKFGKAFLFYGNWE